MSDTDSASNRTQPYILLTGATGFLGQYLLARLLRDGHRCLVGLRGPMSQAWTRLGGIMADHGIDVDLLWRQQRLVPMRCDLAEGEIDAPPGGAAVTDILHAAASTRFDADGAGDPRRTNVDGTATLLDWAARHCVPALHLVSTAYVCGRVACRVPERLSATPPDAHNAYEYSKWEAEQLAAAWSSVAPGRRLTIYRPSVIVGASASGRAARFDGFYLLVRATELLSRRYAASPQRQAIPLRIAGCAQAGQNIVPVDWVADCIAAVVNRPSRQGAVYHLVNPAPPTNAQIKLALERYFDLAGGRFVDPRGFDALVLNETEAAFRSASRPVRHYLEADLRFDRGNTAELERLHAIACPTYDAASLRRLIDVAVRCHFGRRRDAAAPDASHWYAAYFERFLPAHLGRSRVVQAAMTITARFAIGERPADAWTCSFEGGHLAGVHRAPAVRAPEVQYTATDSAFWKAISGACHPEELLLGGEAEVGGDVERALKLAVLLNVFAREFPCDRQTLAAYLPVGATTATAEPKRIRRPA